jgi:hypothetical protein
MLDELTPPPRRRGLASSRLHMTGLEQPPLVKGTPINSARDLGISGDERAAIRLRPPPGLRLSEESKQRKRGWQGSKQDNTYISSAISRTAEADIPCSTAPTTHHLAKQARRIISYLGQNTQHGLRPDSRKAGTWQQAGPFNREH